MYSSVFSVNSSRIPTSSLSESSRSKAARPPIHNPYDKFTQVEFDAWIGGITGALRKALGHEDEVEESERLQSADHESEANRLDGDIDHYTSPSEEAEASDDSLVDRKVQYASVKGKSRDPGEGPGLGSGTITEPIELGSDSDEEDDVFEEEDDGDYDEHEEDDYRYHHRTERSGTTHSSPTRRFTPESHEVLVPSRGDQHVDDEEVFDELQDENGLFSDGEGDEDQPIELISDEEEENDENRRPEFQPAKSPQVAVHTVGDEDQELDEIEVEYEGEEEQPSEENTAFPPLKDPFNAQPVDIRDPWAGPHTYAEDFYSGGDLRADTDGSVNPDRLNENDGSDISAFLTPGIITPNDPENDSVASDSGSRTGVPFTPLRVALARKLEPEIFDFDDDEEDELDEGSRPSRSSPTHSSPSPRKQVLDSLYGDLVTDESGNAGLGTPNVETPTKEVIAVDEEDIVMDDREPPQNIPEQVPEQESDDIDIVEVVSATLVPKSSIEAVITEEMAELTGETASPGLPGKEEIAALVDVAVSTSIKITAESTDSESQGQVYTVHEVLSDDEHEHPLEGDTDVDVESIPDMGPRNLVPEYDVEEPETAAEERTAESRERGDSLGVISVATSCSATPTQKKEVSLGDLALDEPSRDHAMASDDAALVVENLLEVMRGKEMPGTRTAAKDANNEEDLVYPEPPEMEISDIPVAAGKAPEADLLKEGEESLVQDTEEVLNQVAKLEQEDDGVQQESVEQDISLPSAENKDESTAREPATPTVALPPTSIVAAGRSDMHEQPSSSQEQPEQPSVRIPPSVQAAPAPQPTYPSSPTSQFPPVPRVPQGFHQQQYNTYSYRGSSTHPLTNTTLLAASNGVPITTNSWIYYGPSPSTSTSTILTNPPTNSSYVPYWGVQTQPVQYNMPLRPPSSPSTSPTNSPTVEQRSNTIRPPPINTGSLAILSAPHGGVTGLGADPYPANLSTPGVMHEEETDEDNNEDELDSSPTEESSSPESLQLSKADPNSAPPNIVQMNGKSHTEASISIDQSAAAVIQTNLGVPAEENAHRGFDADSHVVNETTGPAKVRFDNGTPSPNKASQRVEKPLRQIKGNKSMSDKSNEGNKRTMNTVARKRSSVGANDKKRKRDDVDAENKSASISSNTKTVPFTKEKGKLKETSRQSSETPSASSSGASVVAKFLQSGSRASSVASISTGEGSGAVQSPNAAHLKELAFPIPTALNQPMLHNHSRKGPVQHQHGPAALSLQAQLQKQRSVPSISSPVAGPSSQPSPTWHNTYRDRVPVTRSHCQYHKISMPEVEDGPHIYFLVPGCALTKPELIKEEEIIDHGDATGEDAARCVPDIVSLDINAYVVGIIRLLVGPDKEQECYFLPQPGEERSRKIRRRGSSKSRGRKDNVLYGDTHTASGHPLSPPTSPRGAPVSTNGSAAGSTSTSTDPTQQQQSVRTLQSKTTAPIRESLSPLSSALTSDDESSGDDYVESPRKRPKGKKAKNLDGPLGSQVKVAVENKPKKAKQLGHDAAAYDPARADDETDSASETDTPAKARKVSKSQLKRTRIVENPADEEEGDRQAKKVKIATPERD
ncbi:hypothetical protein Moror_17740 [Moniliophthora roreri MCA 2997]|uniref:Uncharacterized protein n=1 Tax=Moniliophthora roreri (strain MCA 2997) TaxID=1381753 RepID=V2Z022_MONRO|nr:hypothetical protein Moror_17740 [Moniliophthora roreri MCA 2997]